MKPTTLLTTLLTLLLLPAPGALALPAGATDDARRALAEALRSPAAMAAPTSPVRRLVRAEALVMAHTRLRARPVFLAAMELAPPGECGAPARLLRAAVRVRPLEAAALAEVAMESSPGCSQVLQVALLLPYRPTLPEKDARSDQMMVAANTTFKDGPDNSDGKSVMISTVDGKSVVASTDRPASQGGSGGPVDDLHGLDLGQPEPDNTGPLLSSGSGLGNGFGPPSSGLLSLPPLGPAVTSVVNQ